MKVPPPESVRKHLQESLVLVHGGMAQNVGPILEMVTEKYLLAQRERMGRASGRRLGFLSRFFDALKSDDVKAIGAATTHNFFGPIQTIIPWASTDYTETLIRAREGEIRRGFLGVLDAGRYVRRRHGIYFRTRTQSRGAEFLQETMSATKRDLQNALPFAMEPVVYDFAINTNGTFAEVLPGDTALLPASYYAFMAPQWLRTDPRLLTPMRRAELDRFGAACRTDPALGSMVETLFDRLIPRARGEGSRGQNVWSTLETYGFDREQHDQIRSDLKNGRTGLAQNRLPPNTVIEDVQVDDIADISDPDLYAQRDEAHLKIWTETGTEALAAGEVGVISLAAGAGSRWTQGAGVVKALHPFCKLGGKHRTFIETHLAKSRKVGRAFGIPLPHVIATSYLTHEPIYAISCERAITTAMAGPLHLSQGKSVGLRLVPMERDLRFAWEELPQRILDEQQQKVRESLHAALIGWAKQTGEGSDYTDNVPSQCLHPVGHWFEIPNLLRNGTLENLLRERPQLKYLMLHNIDTVGANVDPLLLGLHIARESCLTFEVINRRIDDRGGGLARVNGKARLVESLAIPREEDEFRLSYYNTMTTWIRHRQVADGFRSRPRELERCKPSRGRHSRRCREDADVYHLKGRKKAVGPRSGRCLPCRAIRETLGRHERARRSSLRLRGRAQGTGPAA